MMRNHPGRGLVLAALSATVAVLAVAPSDALAKRKPRRPEATSAAAPIGLQGRAGAGTRVAIGFVLADAKARPTDVEAQYAYDMNGDGMISESEWRPLAEDRLDPRDSRGNSKPFLFASGPDAGTQNAIVWESARDVAGRRLVGFEYALTTNGRRIPDPNNPGSFLFATGPQGAAVGSGVKVRVRTRKRHGGHGSWVFTDTFSLDNDRPPSMSIDAAESGATVRVNWTAFDGDSEDFNGNGVLDVADGEDENANGVLDSERLGVAFDFHRLAAGEDPATMTDAALDALDWSPCTRRTDVGDTDALDARPGVPIPTSGALAGVPSAPPPVGRHWLFAWDAAHDVGATPDGFILRATPFDEHRSVGATVYSRTIVHAGN